MKDVIQKLRSLSNIKKAAQATRKSLLEAEFGLEDKFCDAEELKGSWENIVLQFVHSFQHYLTSTRQN